jgi:hypothetical protein
MFAKLQATTRVRLFSLQQGPGRRMAATIPAWDIAVPDLESLAATIMSLDLIISVDTMVAHLAGALGALVWTMLHADCDWRWPKVGRQSTWYLTMKLFHKPRLASGPTSLKTLLKNCADTVLQQRRASDHQDGGQNASTL